MGRIFVINPGSTSTKIGIFENSNKIFKQSVSHHKDRIDSYRKIINQLDYRMGSINSFIGENSIDMSQIDYFVGRGGFLRPLQSGLYRINEKMVEDLAGEKYGKHASNLGAVIAYNFGKKYGKPSFIFDPICVDELDPVARISGHPLFERRSIFHALNQKKAARIIAERLNSSYQDLTLVVAHLGGGITVGLHKHGRVVDVNNGTEGEGPFTPERSGGMELGSFLKYVFENDLGFGQAFRMVMGEGGLSAYFGTVDFKELMKKYKEGGDKKVRVVIEAMAYQVSQEIAARSILACGDIDGIIFTGGLAHSETFVGLIKDKVKHLAKNIFVIPGENELEALAEGVVLLQESKIEAMEY